MKCECILKKNTKIFSIIIILIFISGFSINYFGVLIYPDQTTNDSPERVILISLDSCSPEYTNDPSYMPLLYNMIHDKGVSYKVCWASIAAETMLGHTTMLTGTHPNSSGVIGNGYYDNETGQTIGVVQDPSFRRVETIIESIEDNDTIKTAFISGKWRLPAFLAQESDIVLGSTRVWDKFPIPQRYMDQLGFPLQHGDGDIYDSWTIRAIIESIKIDDPDFIFVNLAWLDVTGHDTGSFNLNIHRFVSQLDYNLNMLFTELKIMGEFENTLFIITGDHGMDTIYDTIDLNEYLTSNGIDVHHIHPEGQSAFIYLSNTSQTNETVELLNQHEYIGIALPRNEMHKIHLDTFINRTGHVYASCKAHYAVEIEMAGIGFPLSTIGTHGGISCRDVPLLLMGPGIKKGQFIEYQIPELVDIVPTIGNLTGWNTPTTCDGRVLYEILQ
ncbi:MAG: hypothetical protein GF329_09850 [Candidatus Lokiarchaeota archaeon]|nr:hypothetical protein [Candidatus Lokiarchaeota archaeon]